MVDETSLEGDLETRLLELAPLPAEAAIELTSKCPFDCVFCTRTETRGAGQNMDYATFESVIRQLGKPSRIYLNAVGESVHYPRLGDAIRLAKSTGARVELTSALGTTPDAVLDEILAAGLDDLHVSLHTLDARLYDEIYRGGATAAKTRAKIDTFLRLRASAGASTRLDFAFVALEQNLPSLPQLADFAERIGVRRIGVLAVMQPSERRHRFPVEIDGNYLSAGFRRRLREVVAQVRGAHPQLEVHTPSLLDACALDSTPREFPWPLPAGARIAGCTESPFERITVLANGDVPACCEDGMEIVGNVGEAALADIWRGPRLGEFRRRYLTGEHPKCRICPAKEAYLPRPSTRQTRAGLESGMDDVRFLQVEPTTRCNLTCGYCCGRHMAQADLALATFEATLKAFPNLQHIELQGEGEPLLHPRLFELATLARSRGIRVSLITNGTLFSPVNIERILAADFEKVLVSLDSLEPATFEALRGGDVHEVEEGTRRLVEARRVRGLARPSVGLAATVVRSTLEQLPELIAFYRRLRLDGGIGTQVLNPMECYAKHYPPSLAREAMPAAELDAHIRELRAVPQVAEAIDGDTVAKGFYGELFQDFAPGKGSCPWLDRGAYVNFQGFVTGCCMIKDTGLYAFGRLGPGPAESADTARLASGRAAMRTQLARGETPSACRGCQVAALALGGADPLSGQSVAEAFVALDAQAWAAHCRGMALRADLQQSLEPELADARTRLERLPPRTREGVADAPLLAQARAECEALRRELEAVRRSKSWKLTGPLRAGYELLASLRKG